MKLSRNAIYGSLLLMPAAVLLWTFTYQPILDDDHRLVRSTPRGRRPSRFVGLEQYETLDPLIRCSGRRSPTT